MNRAFVDWCIKSFIKLKMARLFVCLFVALTLSAADGATITNAELLDLITENAGNCYFLCFGFYSLPGIFFSFRVEVIE